MADNEEQSSTRPPRTVVRPFRGPVSGTPSTPLSPVAPPTRPAMPPFASRTAPPAKPVPEPPVRAAAVTPVVPVAPIMPRESESAAIVTAPPESSGSIATSLAADWQSLLRATPPAARTVTPPPAATEDREAERALRVSEAHEPTSASIENAALEVARDSDVEQGSDADVTSGSADDFEVEAYAYPAVVAEASSDVIEAVVRRDFATPHIGVSAVGADYPHIDGAAAPDDVDAYRLAAIESAIDDVEEDPEDPAAPAADREASGGRSFGADTLVDVSAANETPGVRDPRSETDALTAATASPAASEFVASAALSAEEIELGAPPVSPTDDDTARSNAETPPTGSAMFASRVPEHYVLPRFDATAGAATDRDVEQSVSDYSLMSHVTGPVADAVVAESASLAPASEFEPTAADAGTDEDISARLNADAARLIDEVDSARARDASGTADGLADDGAVSSTRAASEGVSAAESEVSAAAIGPVIETAASETASETATEPAPEAAIAGASAAVSNESASHVAASHVAVRDAAVIDVASEARSEVAREPASRGVIQSAHGTTNGAFASAADLTTPASTAAVTGQSAATVPGAGSAQLSLAGALDRLAARIRAGELTDRQMPTGSSDASVLAAALSTLLAGES